MSDHNIRTSSKAGRGGFHAGDLRFAGAVSAGLVSAILVGGALLAPVASWDDSPSNRATETTAVLKLRPTPPIRHRHARQR